MHQLAECDTDHDIAQKRREENQTLKIAVSLAFLDEAKGDEQTKDNLGKACGKGINECIRK